jgi:hypothetical protein
MTNQTPSRPSKWKEALKLCLGTVAIFSLVLSLNAQETIGSPGSKTETKSAGKTVPDMPPVKDSDGKKANPKIRLAVDQPEGELPARAGLDNIARSRSVVRQGYTRPGNPEDGFDPRTAKVLPVAFGVDTMKILGATVYFAVYERSGLGDNDTWGAGMPNFDGRFVEGQNFQGGFSPRLDTKAKYLYVYQIVNDRLLEPNKNRTKLAVDGEKAPTAEEISTFYLKLLVDPRYITSWGHFRGTGFTAEVANRDVAGDIKQMADGVTTDIRLAVSSNPSILAEIPNPRYMRRSPAYSLQALGNGFALGSSTLNLSKTTYFENLVAAAKAAEANKTQLVSYVGNTIKAAASANEPSFVQLMYFNGEERVEGAANLADEDIARAIFRVDFKGKQIVGHGQHSVAFGFTTDLPPTDEPIRIATAAGAASLGNGIRQVAFDSEGDAVGVGAAVGTGIGLAVGTAPTPTPPVAVAGSEGGSGGGSVSAGLGGMAGVGGGGVGGIPSGAGGIGGGRGIGGGSGGGFGGGQGGGQGDAQGKTQTKNGQQQGQVGTTGTIINFQASLVNQQQQKQQQQQQQQQTGGGCCCTPTTNVVPAPASLLLGLFGLPCIYFFRRRRSNGEETLA